MKKQVLGAVLACLMAMALITSGCGGSGQSLTPGPGGPQNGTSPGGSLELDISKRFNYDTSDTSHVIGNMLPPWYSGEYNSYQLNMIGGTPPYTWKYKTTSGTAASIQLSGISFKSNGLVEGTAEELWGGSLYRSLYPVAVVTDSSRPALSVDVGLRLDIIDNRESIARKVAEQHLTEANKTLDSLLAGQMPAGSKLSWTYTIGKPKKVDGAQWSVPVNYKLNVSVTVQGYSTSVGGNAATEIIVDVKKKAMLDEKLISYKIG